MDVVRVLGKVCEVEMHGIILLSLSIARRYNSSSSNKVMPIPRKLVAQKL